MKKWIILLIFFLIPAIVFAAGTVSGIHEEDGTPTAGYFVAVYSFGTVGDYAVDNATLVGTDVTDANGEWGIATTLTTPHLIIIKDTANNAKKSIQIWETPTPD